ncbi:Uncharacterised protein [Mycobacteroides abscessus subsp. abscessus]|nr:Uncharacterised protein [Mycobacteroides abscessus subsp. abscessus]
MPTSLVPGRMACTPSMATLFRPRLRSACDRPATGAVMSFSRSSGDRPVVCSGRPAAARDPHASSRWRSSTAGSEPSAGSKSPRPSTTSVTSRPLVGAPAVVGASTSTSITSPGRATDDPAGVPVRITSPGSRVRCWDRSATNCASGKIIPAVVSSCTNSPLRQVRTRRAAGSTVRASIRRGPSGV